MKNKIPSDESVNETVEDWDDQNQKPVELAVGDVGEARLEELIKNFIVPEGTDYGLTPDAFDARVRLAHKQLATGSLRIVFDQVSDTTVLMSSQDFRKVFSDLR